MALTSSLPSTETSDVVEEILKDVLVAIAIDVAILVQRGILNGGRRQASCPVSLRVSNCRYTSSIAVGMQEIISDLLV